MSASIIPPPIVQSVYASPSRVQVQSVVLDPPSALDDRQHELEADLQFLLDAQAEGLVRGLEGGLQDDQTSTGSTTPTARSVTSPSSHRGRRAPRKKPGLRSARKGIYSTIIALSSLKDDELRDADEEARRNEETLEKINSWEKKRGGLQEAARIADSSEDTVRVQRLRQEASTLQMEINAMELQLADMKSRHGKLMKQASAVENSVQAKLASYTSSLRMLEEDVQKFLSLEPSPEENRTEPEGGESSMWQLPPKRRTLEMAKQHWNTQRGALAEQRESKEREKAALDEGAAVWKDVMGKVNGFEQQLRSSMASMSSADPSAVNHIGQPQDPNQRLEEVIQHLDEVIGALDSKFDLARSRNWNLLVAAIGAEVDALKQGRQLLRDLLPSADQHLEDTANSSIPSRSESGDEINALDKSFVAATRRMSNGTDSDPDPELLFSKHDTDTEESSPVLAH